MPVNIPPGPTLISRAAGCRLPAAGNAPDADSAGAAGGSLCCPTVAIDRCA